MGGLFRMAPAVTCLVAINIGLFAITWFTERQDFSLIWTLGLFYFDSPQFSFYQIVTHLFMHGGPAHIFFNMFALLMFGSQLEALWGAKRFLIFYAVTGLGAIVLHQAVQAYDVFQLSGSIMPANKPELLSSLSRSNIEQLSQLYSQPVVGASGAIFGLLLGFAVIFPNAKLFLMFIPIPVKAKYAIPVLMLVELFLGVRNFSFDNIAHFAHLGGALFGFVLVKLWSRQKMTSRLDERL